MTKGIKTKYGKPLLEWEDLECYVKDLEKEIERLHSIIKEVREIFKYYGAKEDIVGYSNYTITGEDLINLLEILDKAGETND